MFDYKLLNSLYYKKEIPTEITSEELVIILFYLAQDKNMSYILKNTLTYFFVIEPLHFYKLLYYSIPKQNKIPFFKKIEKIVISEDITMNELIKFFNWNKRDIQLIEPILNKVLDKNIINKELGII